MVAAYSPLGEWERYEAFKRLQKKDIKGIALGFRGNNPQQVWIDPDPPPLTDIDDLRTGGITRRQSMKKLAQDCTKTGQVLSVNDGQFWGRPHRTM